MNGKNRMAVTMTNESFDCTAMGRMCKMVESTKGVRPKATPSIIRVRSRRVYRMRTILKNSHRQSAVMTANSAMNVYRPPNNPANMMMTKMTAVVALRKSPFNLVVDSWSLVDTNIQPVLIYSCNLGPKAKSPASPSPGTIYDLAVSSSSKAPSQMSAVPCFLFTYSRPWREAIAVTICIFQESRSFLILGWPHPSKHLWRAWGR